MDRSKILLQLTSMGEAEAKRLMASVFGDEDGQKALLFILVKIGGLGVPQGALRPGVNAHARLIHDGRQDAVLEIARMAGFSPFDLALRVLDVKPLTLKDLENETEIPAKDVRAGRRTGRRAAATPTFGAATAAAESHAFGGDADPESGTSEPAGDDGDA